MCRCRRCGCRPGGASGGVRRLRCGVVLLHCTAEARIVHAARVVAIDSQRVEARAVVAAVVACASEMNSLLGMGTGPAETAARSLA